LSTFASNNPVFSKDTFTRFDHAYSASPSTVMTVQGTAGKTFLLLAILSATAALAWNATLTNQMQTGALMLAAIGGLVVGLVTSFKPTFAPWTAPVYAALEGVFLGALSCVIENRLGAQFHGIAIQAVALTGGTLFFMLFLYTTGIVKVTEKLKTGIIAAIGAVLVVKLIFYVMLMFGNAGGQVLFVGTPLGILFSLVVVGVAAFSLLLDFDFIDQGARAEAPKYMEWYGAFGLMVTLIWLYLEILRLLMKLQDRR
jgi:uncharacterized YccA/Bax inhibitor family protein